MDGKYLKVFVDWLERYQKLSDAEFGRLMRAAIAYCATGEHTNLPGREELLLDGIKLDIDRDRTRYENTSESRASAGEKGAQSRWGSADSYLRRSERLSRARAIARHTKQEWEEMLNYFNHTCVRCEDAESEIVKDHIVPIYQNGSDGIDNLQPLCVSCNSSKGAENIDHRIAFAQAHGLELPAKWLTTPSKRLATSSKNGQDKDEEEDEDEDKGKGKRKSGQDAALAARFATFWTAYPRKVSKADALKAFVKREPTQELLDAMLTAIATQKQGRQWQEDGGKYIPHPATWLNRECWLDEIEPQADTALPKPTTTQFIWPEDV